MYSATTSSVTFPLLQQKYPRTHRCRPQNCVRNGANSCSILYARLPLQPLHQPADCHLRRDRYQKVHVIFAHVPLQDVDVQSPANLTDKIPDSMTGQSHQQRLAILRHPDQVQVDLEYAVHPITVLVHGPILPQRNAEAFA